MSDVVFQNKIQDALDGKRDRGFSLAQVRSFHFVYWVFGTFCKLIYFGNSPNPGDHTSLVVDYAAYSLKLFTITILPRELTHMTQEWLIHPGKEQD